MIDEVNGRPLLELRGLTTHYPTRRGVVPAMEAVDLTVRKGEVLGLVGESGCGKSTVLLSILRLIRAPGKIVAGQALFRGQDLLELSNREMRELRGREIAMIFQDPLSTLNPAYPIGEQIREALYLHKLVPGRRLPGPIDIAQKRREKERVLQVMHEVGIPSPMDRYASYPHQFSGGMQQRALIAMALICGPALLLADEPTTALDVTIQAQIVELMRKINRERGTAIILVTHDLALAAEFCDRIAVMYAGRIVEQGSTDKVVNDPQHPYTRGLLACRPRVDLREQRVDPIPGNVPDLAALDEGCAFAQRCPLARSVCGEGPVPLMVGADGRSNRCLEPVGFHREPGWTWEDVVRV